MYVQYLNNSDNSDTHLMPAEIPEPANAQKSDADARSSLLPGLLKLVSDQHNLLCEIKREQQNNFSVVQDQIASLKASLSREQRDGWTEIKVDQRIFINPLCIMIIIYLHVIIETYFVP